VSRRGLALLLAIVALALISGIAATAVELAMAEHKGGAGLLAATQARAAAEAALAEASQGWPRSLRPSGVGSSQILWNRVFTQGVNAELRLVATEGPYLIAVGQGTRRAAGGQVIATAEVQQIVRPDSVPPDTLERPARLPRSRWRSPP
jgi:hypothetical protein